MVYPYKYHRQKKYRGIHCARRPIQDGKKAVGDNRRDSGRRLQRGEQNQTDGK